MLREITKLLERMARGQSGHTVRYVDPPTIPTLTSAALVGATTLTVEGKSVFRLADDRLFETVGSDEPADTILPIPGRGTPTRLREIDLTPAIAAAVQRYLAASPKPTHEQRKTKLVKAKKKGAKS
jgi:hypothetical protein